MVNERVACSGALVCRQSETLYGLMQPKYRDEKVVKSRVFGRFPREASPFKKPLAVERVAKGPVLPMHRVKAIRN